MELITNAAKAIPGYEGLYSVTRFGVVYSLPRTGRRKLEVMKPVDNMPAGYLRASLTRDGHTDLCYIHRLVALAYIKNPNHKPMVNHKNGNKRDNCVENLEWVTSMENHTHAFEIGLYPRRRVHPSEKAQVVQLVRQGVPLKKVAEKYGLRPGGLYSLLRRFKEAELRMAA